MIGRCLACRFGGLGGASVAVLSGAGGASRGWGFFGNAKCTGWLVVFDYRPEARLVD
jgi:hypothetical protein